MHCIDVRCTVVQNENFCKSFIQASIQRKEDSSTFMQLINKCHFGVFLIYTVVFPLFSLTSSTLVTFSSRLHRTLTPMYVCTSARPKSNEHLTVKREVEKIACIVSYTC